MATISIMQCIEGVDRLDFFCKNGAVWYPLGTLEPTEWNIKTPEHQNKSAYMKDS